MNGSLQGIVRTGEVVLVSQGDYGGEGITEGPVWHPAGYLTFVRHHLSQLFRWSPLTGETEVIRENTGYGNGCTLDRQGRLVMCEGENRRISRTEPDGSITALTTEWHGKRYNKPNDIVCRSDGSLYFTDPAGRVDPSRRQLGFSGVFRIAPDGEVHLATDQCEYPNGLAFSPDESILYVAITRRDRECLTEGDRGAECRHRYIRAFDVAPDGSLSNNRIFATLYAPVAGGPDGLKVDVDGRVYCASAGGVWVFDADGDFLGTIATPAKARNLAFGGPDNRSLFICAGESVYRAELDVEGIAAARGLPASRTAGVPVGWIGLGAMGLPMAAVLSAAGHPLTVCDLNPAAVRRARAWGATIGDTPAAVARGCDVLCVMVATPAQLDDVLFGPSGAAPALRPGSVVVVMATVGPAVMEATATRLGRQGVLTVDAPVSGGVGRAAAGELTFMISGPEEGLRIVSPLVAAMARDAVRFGDRPGDAQRVKLVNQLLCGVHIAAAAEALALAGSLGLDQDRCWEVLRSGAAASFMLEDRGARMLHPTDEVRSAVSIFVKDMTLVAEAAQDTGLAVPVADAARGLFEEGAARGLGDRDDSTLLELWRSGPLRR